ncbi:uncharacterized protein PHACADRAFT_136001 [Phanerochaete carnosa HHB-10118-sp]|uniref:Uncharacterized protein n=1 Tax=Phanerochaete carnosa (strain HHB-10118-sp) TaxID=650164 RepID=K5WHQ7_PHACS|nr:uncharacterized protein PHACADRAFT_136001 [Phanerochaete carnosa HHB-10118-sp]EKM58865.1 hypothetical protein PHACADRAFT_136001 [Phanerochaete carnosa HHB-10118-sp]
MCKEVQGALLDLKSEAYAESLYENPRIMAYMARQHDSWYTFARTDHLVEPEDIVFVSGWVKTPANWATAAFRDTSKTREVSLKGQIWQFVGLKLSASTTKEYSGPPMHRQGSKYPKRAGRNSTRDQCVFVKRIKIKKRLGIVRVLIAGAGHDKLPPGNSDPETVAGVVAVEELLDTEDLGNGGALFSEGQGKAIDPLDALLDYILEVSGADCAVARDEDIEAMLGGDYPPVDFSTYLRKSQPPVVVEDSQYGSISIPNLMYRGWVELQHRRITSLDLQKWPYIREEGSGDLVFGQVQLPSTEKPGDHKMSKSAYLEFADSTAGDTHMPCFTLSDDGKLLAASWRTVGSDILVWRTSDGLTLQHLRDPEYTDGVTAVAFSPDGRRLVTGSADETAVIWDIRSGKPIMRLRGHTYSLTDVAFSPDGVRIVTGSADYVVKFWDAATGLPLCTFSLDSPVRKLVFSSDGSRLAVMLEDKIALYDVGAPIVQLGAIHHYNVTDYRSVAFSPTGDRIFICAQGLVGRLYNTDSCKELLRLEEPNRKIAVGTFSPDGSSVASIASENRRFMLIVQDASKGTIRFKERIWAGGTAVAFSPDGTLVAAAGEMNVVVWNMKSGELVADLREMQRVSDIRFLPDGRRILFVGRTDRMGIWNVADTLRIR